MFNGKALSIAQSNSRPSRRLLLMLSLFALLAVYPYAPAGPSGQLILIVVNGAILAAGIYAVSDRVGDVFLAGAIGVAQLGFALTNLAGESLLIQEVSLALLGTFYLFTLARTLQFTFAEGVVDSDRLYAAVAVYLLFGLAFGCVYALLEALLGGAFSVANPRFGDLTYFSFVTLTTLGYGDILPIADQVRSLASIEAICGVMYVALLVARLVGMSVGSAARNSE